jgi:hypothetical protein
MSVRLTAIYELTDLDRLQAQAAHIFRDFAATIEKPALLFSGGKDSARALVPVQRSTQEGRQHPGLPAVQLDRARYLVLHPRREYRAAIPVLRAQSPSPRTRRHVAAVNRFIKPMAGKPRLRRRSGSARLAMPPAPAASNRPRRAPLRSWPRSLRPESPSEARPEPTTGSPMPAWEDRKKEGYF